MTVREPRNDREPPRDRLGRKDTKASLAGAALRRVVILENPKNEVPEDSNLAREEALRRHEEFRSRILAAIDAYKGPIPASLLFHQLFGVNLSDAKKQHTRQFGRTLRELVKEGLIKNPAESRLVWRVTQSPPKSMSVTDIKMMPETKTEQSRIKSPEQLRDEEVEQLISVIEQPDVRLVLVLRRRREFSNALEMKTTLMEEARLTNDVISRLIRILKSEGLVIFGLISKDSYECFGELTSDGLRFLNEAIQAYQAQQLARVIGAPRSTTSKDSSSPENNKENPPLDAAAAAQRNRLKRMKDLDPTPALGQRREVKSKNPQAQSPHTSKRKSGRRTGGRGNKLA